MSADLIEHITIAITRTARIELSRRAKARRLKLEDVAGEIVDLEARRIAGLAARFTEAAREVDRRLRLGLSDEARCRAEDVAARRRT